MKLSENVDGGPRNTNFCDVPDSGRTLTFGIPKLTL